MLCKLSRILACVLPGFALACGEAPTATTSPIVYDACAPLAVVTDPAITPDERRGVIAGLDLWNARANTRLTIATSTTTHAPSAELPLIFQNAAAAFHGYYDPQAGMVFINHQLANQHQRAVTVAHEIGHAFGLAHVASSSRPSLMNHGNLNTEPTPVDVDELIALWGACHD